MYKNYFNTQQNIKITIIKFYFQCIKAEKNKIKDGQTFDLVLSTTMLSQLKVKR